MIFAGPGNGRSGKTFVSRDNATPWQQVGEPDLATAAVPRVFAFDAADAEHVLAATIGGTVLESVDRGETGTVLRRA